ncbi:Transcriptional regulator, BadM/Rrf2 family [Candidatus Zixiibacteriota bacterium]|nr:Transcriptional regulator, BadM/Rrf2 family [candidate division Zixibacteria bacterium]
MLSLKAQYGLRAIVALAANYGKGPIQAKEIASTQGVPVRYLELLLAQLRRARLVDANRGKNGGYILARDPGGITVWDVVTAFEGKMIITQLREPGTPEDNAHGLSFIWKEAEKKVIDYLASIKVADIMEMIRTGQEMYFI